MANDNLTCPGCNGRVQNMVLVMLATTVVGGDPGCEERLVKCSTCKGTGVITPEHQRRRELGEEVRAKRLTNYVTQHEAARRLGVGVVEYSQMERGNNEDDALYERALEVTV